jgi:hypothetical protein
LLGKKILPTAISIKCNSSRKGKLVFNENMKICWLSILILRLHGSLVRQPCLAALPGNLAWQPCPAALSASLARQPYPAALPGSLVRQPCPAALPGSLARQPCPAALPGSLARQPGFYEGHYEGR